MTLRKISLPIAGSGALLAIWLGYNLDFDAHTTAHPRTLVLVTTSGQRLSTVFEGLRPEPRGLVALQQGALDVRGACKAGPQEIDTSDHYHSNSLQSSDRSTLVSVASLSDDGAVKGTAVLSATGGLLPVQGACGGHYAYQQWYLCNIIWSCWWSQCSHGSGPYSRGCEFNVYWTCYGLCPLSDTCAYL